MRRALLAAGVASALAIAGFALATGGGAPKPASAAASDVGATAQVERRDLVARD